MTETATRPTAPAQDWQAWAGRQETVRETVNADSVAALAATLDLEHAPERGAPLPPGWHWLFFNPFVPRRQLGTDGHPQRGGFLPPVPLPRRMWAGSRITYLSPLLVGHAAERESTIEKIQAKTGRAGSLVFVTLRHRIASAGEDRILEEQDIVYREATTPGAQPPALTPAPAESHWSRLIVPDPVLLFRYSALTSNGHRIHYDQPYARDEEHYPDLVVHGPLTATLLQGFAQELRPGAVLESFTFRGVHPLFVRAPFTLAAMRDETDDTALTLWARGPQGELAMQASARFGRP